MHASLIISLSLASASAITAFPLLGNLGGAGGGSSDKPSSDNSASPNCEGDSLISTLNCNVVDLGLDLDISPDVEILKGRDLVGRAEQGSRYENEHGTQQGAGPNCEGDSLVSALNCNVVDVDAALDVLPDVDVLKKDKRSKDEEESWEDAVKEKKEEKEEDEAEEGSDGPNCEGDSLVTLLNCNDVAVDLGADLSPKIDLGKA